MQCGRLRVGVAACTPHRQDAETPIVGSPGTANIPEDIRPIGHGEWHRACPEHISSEALVHTVLGATEESARITIYLLVYRERSYIPEVK